ncbi:hypothetical protein IJG92_02090 [Candidatus Saccharibacteria bacterium]|nr:hypothetical protein [Candidatus Saccharibacteria bacterium]
MGGEKLSTNPELDEVARREQNRKRGANIMAELNDINRSLDCPDDILLEEPELQEDRVSEAAHLDKIAPDSIDPIDDERQKELEKARQEELENSEWAGKGIRDNGQEAFSAGNLRLEQLGLSARVLSALGWHSQQIANGEHPRGPSKSIETVDDILNTNRRELSQIRGLGAKGLAEIENKLRVLGYTDFNIFSKYPYYKNPKQKS